MSKICERQDSHYPDDKRLRQLSQADLKLLHKLSSMHEQAIAESDTCGCFYCLSTFPAAEVEEWTIEPWGGQTALCPHCEIDSVLPGASVKAAGYELGPELLEQMKKYWFDAPAQ